MKKDKAKQKEREENRAFFFLAAFTVGLFLTYDFLRNRREQLKEPAGKLDIHTQLVLASDQGNYAEVDRLLDILNKQNKSSKRK